MAEAKVKEANKKARILDQDDELNDATAQASGEERVIDATKFDYASRDPM